MGLGAIPAAAGQGQGAPVVPEVAVEQGGLWWPKQGCGGPGMALVAQRGALVSPKVSLAQRRAVVAQGGLWWPKQDCGSPQGVSGPGRALVTQAGLWWPLMCQWPRGGLWWPREGCGGP